jgi:hypothetical protein
MLNPNIEAKCSKCGVAISVPGMPCGSCGFDPLKPTLKDFRDDIKFGSFLELFVGVGILIFVTIRGEDPTGLWRWGIVAITGAVFGIRHSYKKRRSIA